MTRRCNARRVRATRWRISSAPRRLGDTTDATGQQLTTLRRAELDGHRDEDGMPAPHAAGELFPLTRLRLKLCPLRRVKRQPTSSAS